MSFSQALATAVSGLRASQAGLSIVAGNVANAETPGYVRKTATQVETAAGDLGVSVRIDAINRVLDQYVQRQLRVETSGASYAGLRAQFYDQLQNVYGMPGSTSALETVFNSFTIALQALSTSPDSVVRPQRRAVGAAQVLAQQLNGMTRRSPGAAQQRRARTGRRGRQGQRCDAADRADQPAARHRRSGRRHHRQSARSARSLRRPAVAADGHQGGRERPQPDHGLHQFRHSAGRHRRLAAGLRCRRAR